MGFGLDVRLSYSCAHLYRDREPSRRGFSLAALSAIAKSLHGLLTRIHMVCAHTAYNLRGVSESDRANLRGNGDDKLLNDKSLPSGAVGFSGIIEMLAEVIGAITFGEPMPKKSQADSGCSFAPV